jgi:hypothetical protein
MPSVGDGEEAKRPPKPPRKASTILGSNSKHDIPVLFVLVEPWLFAVRIKTRALERGFSTVMSAMKSFLALLLLPLSEAA